MKIKQIQPQMDWALLITAEDGRQGIFNVQPFLDCEAFEELHDPAEFLKLFNGEYYIEWACGADLSADTIEAQWQLVAAPGTVPGAGGRAARPG